MGKKGHKKAQNAHKEFLKRHDMETRGRGDAGTRGLGDSGTRRHGDAGTYLSLFKIFLCAFCAFLWLIDEAVADSVVS